MMCETIPIDFNSFLTTTGPQEKSLGKLICPKCPYFSTNSKEEYENHFKNSHIDINNICCLYCDLYFELAYISDHIETHFNQNLYSTNVCKICDHFVKMDGPESILDHLIFRHNCKLFCPICQLEFNQHSEFDEHIKNNMNIVYHCTFDGCFIKTHRKKEFDYHKWISSHNNKLFSEEHIFNCSFKRNQQYYEYKTENALNNDETTEISSVEKMDIDIVPNDENPKLKFNYLYNLNCTHFSIEESFKVTFSDINSDITEKLMKMKQYYLGVKDNNKSVIFYCSHCDFSSVNLYVDILKHILISHLQINPLFVRSCLRAVISHREDINIIPNVPVDVSQIESKDNENIIEISDSDNSIKSMEDHSFNIPKNSNKETEIENLNIKTVMKLSVVKDLLDANLNLFGHSYEKVLREKISKIDQYMIGITEDDYQKRFYCLKCSYFSRHNHADVRKHILMVHLAINKQFIRPCLKSLKYANESFVPTVLNKERPNERVHDFQLDLSDVDNKSSKLDDIETKPIRIDDSIESKAIQLEDGIDIKLPCVEIVPLSEEEKLNHQRILMEFKLARSKNKSISLNYSQKAFDKFYEYIDSDSYKILKQKMDKFKTYSVRNVYVNEVRKFVCSACDHSTIHHQGDIKKHIMAIHCNINYKDVKNCMKFCKSDNSILHLSDNQIIQSINKGQTLTKENIYNKIDRSNSKRVVKNSFVNDNKNQINSLNTPKELIKNESIFKPTNKYIINQSFVNPNNKQSNSIISPMEPIINQSFDNPIIKRSYSMSQLQEPMKKSKPTWEIAKDKNTIVIEKEISLSFSETILKALCDIENVSKRFLELKEKLKFYCGTKIRIGLFNNSTIYICSKCNWYTDNSISRVSTHIIEEHTAISSYLQPIVRQCTKLTNQGTLMSDMEIDKLGWNGQPILSQTTADNLFIDLTNY